jgi:hypothetical protein
LPIVNQVTHTAQHAARGSKWARFSSTLRSAIQLKTEASGDSGERCDYME